MGILRTWISGASKDLNNGSNYSPIGALSPSDDLFFTSTSVIDATTSASFTVNSITADASYTGGLFFKNSGALLGDSGGYSLYLSGSGNRQLENSLTFNGISSTVYFGSGTKTLDCTNCDMTFNNWYQQIVTHKNFTINSISVNAGDDLTISGDGTTTIRHATNTPFITLNTYSTFTLNSSLIMSFPFALNVSAFNFLSGYVFNGSGPVTLFGSTAAYINLAVNYTGTGDWTNNASTILISSPSSFSGGFTSLSGSILYCNSTLTFNGNNKKFYVQLTDCTSCSLYWNGTDGTFAIANTSYFNSLNLGNGASLNLSSSPYSLFFESSSTPLTMGNNSILKGSGPAHFGLLATGNFHNIGTGCSIITTGMPLYFSALANNITASFPAFNFPSASINVTAYHFASYGTTGYTVRWTGDTTCTNLSVYPENGDSKDGTFDFNNYNLSLSGTLSSGTQDSINALPARPSVFKFGNGIFNIGPYDAQTITTNTGAVTYYYQNCRINCSGNWTFPNSNNFYTVINPGNSYVKLQTGGALNVNTLGLTTSTPAFNDLEINCSSNYTVLGGPLRANNFYVTSGGFTNQNASILSGNLIVYDANTYGFGPSITFTGNSKRAYFDSSASIPTSLNNTQIIWTGTDGTWTDNKGVVFGSLTVSDGSSLNIVYGTAKTNFWCAGNTVSTPMFTLRPNSRLTINSPVQFYSYSGIKGWDCTTSLYTLDGTAPIEAKLSSPTVSCSALTYSGTGDWTMLVGQSSTPTFNFTGALSFGHNLTFIPYASNSHGTINFAGPSITFPNSDSTFSINDYPGDTLYHYYDGSNCAINFLGQRCSFKDNNNKTTIPYKTFKRLILGPNSQVTCNGLYPTVFQSIDSTPLVLNSSSHLTLNTQENLYLANSGIPFSIANNAILDGTAALTIGAVSPYGGYLPYGTNTTAGSTIFVDINSSYTSTGTGTITNPYNFDQFIAHNAHNTVYRLRGLRNLVGGFAKNAGYQSYIRAWDLIQYGPWRITTTGTTNINMTALVGSIEDGILYTGSIQLTLRRVANCILKSTTDIELGNYTNYTEFDGCTLIGLYAMAAPTGGMVMQDCIVDIPISAGQNYTFNNCVFTRPSFAGNTFNNCQFSWTGPTWPAWNDPKGSFTKALLNYSTITTPPRPGCNYPNYAGYQNNPWTYTSDLFGGARNDIGSYYDASALPSGPLSVSLPELNFMGSGGTFQIKDVGIHNNTEFVQTGNLKMGTNTCDIYLVNDSSVDFHCDRYGPYDMTCGALRPGVDSTNSAFNIYWGLGNHSIKSYTGSIHNAPGQCIQYFQRSVWYNSGDWTYGSRHNISFIPGNSTLNQTGPSTLVSNGKPFNFVQINGAPDTTVTLADNFVCHGYKKVIGTLNANGKKFAITGDYQSTTNY